MWRTLKHIGRTHRRKLIATFTLVGLENLLMLAYPIFGGWAINAVIAGNVSRALLYALVVLIMWLIGAARRSLDTRTFTRIYTQIAVPVVLEQRSRNVPHSAVTARVALSREFVSFFEEHLPIAATSLVSIFGACIMLLVIEPWVGVFAKDGSDRQLWQHYSLVARLRVLISNREAVGYLSVGVAMSLLFGFAFTLMTLKGYGSAGHIYAVSTYLWMFAMSLDDVPRLVEQYSNLQDISRRVQVGENDDHASLNLHQKQT